MGIEVRKGQGDVKLTRGQFERRLRERFYDPEFQNVERQIGEVIDVAWQAYDQYRKSPRKRKAGPGFVDPGFELLIEWLETRERIQQAQRDQKDASRRGVFSVVVHGETVGGETLRRSLTDWLTDMKLLPAHAAGRHRSLHRILRTVRDEP